MLMKKINIALVIIFLTQCARGQNGMTRQDSIAARFDDVKAAMGKAEKLWERNLYGPILLVNPFTRQAYANYADSTGVLKQEGPIFTGTLPPKTIIANASIRWGGVDWAMILLPFLPPDPKGQINLFAHELFHKAQAPLRFRFVETNNNHLDQKDGRIFLRLELEALKKALHATSITDMRSHLTSALTFRSYRHLLYPGSDTTENWLELNEGIAEYTGMIIAERDKQEALGYFDRKLNEFLAYPTYVRTFAYRTISAYGYLLHDTNEYWNKEITTQTNLSDYFRQAFTITLPTDIRAAIDSLIEHYHGNAIITEETAREEGKKKRIAEYNQKFIELPHLTIRFERKSVSFDARNILPLGDNGIVYPSMKASDVWGVLTVESGALMSSDRTSVTVSMPLKMLANNVFGDGWSLQLTEGYTEVKDDTSSNYKLIKKEGNK